MKIKRIFCGILTAAMLLGQTGAVWAEATDTASESPTPTPVSYTHLDVYKRQQLISLIIFFARSYAADAFAPKMKVLG